MQIRKASFTSEGARCEATLHLPDGAGPRPPVVVMAHGIAAQSDFGLGPFVERFVAAGMAVFTFDYRGFGASEGEPRFLVDGRRHVQDFMAAIDHVKGRTDVDAARVALWGTSYAGGHVLAVAARRRDLVGVVSQVPFVDGLASTRLVPVGTQLRSALAGLRDVAGAAIGLAPHYVPVIAKTGLCLLATSDSFEGYGALVPPDTTWKNRVPARIFLTLPAYRPGRAARNIAAPVLMIVAERDSLIPAAAARKTAARIPRCRLEVLPLGHFEPYRGAAFERVIVLELDFLKGVFWPKTEAAPSPSVRSVEGGVRAAI